MSSSAHQPPPASPRATGVPPPVSPKFSPPPATSSLSYLRPPVSPGGNRAGSAHNNAHAGLHMPPLSPGGRKSNTAGSAAGMGFSSAGNGTSTATSSAGNSLRSEALNRAHRRVRSGGSLSGVGTAGTAAAGGGSSSSSSIYRRQHLQMRLSTGFDGGSAAPGIGAFPSSPSHRGLPPSSPRRLRSVSYDESDTVGQDELDAIRAELEKRKEKQALHDQRRRELEEMMSSAAAAATTPKRTPPTRKISVTKTASCDDGISPLKMGDSASKNRRPKKKEAKNYDDGKDNDNDETGDDGNDDRPTVVSPTSPDRGEETEGEGPGRSDRSDRAAGSTSRGGTTGRARGRSLTPRDRSVNGASALQGAGGGPPPRRLLSHSPAPQNMGVRRLGRAVDAVLARRKRRGSISAQNTDPSIDDATNNTAESSEQYNQSLTDEEKHVLAKIIVAIDTKLERELDLLKVDLQDKKKAEATAKEALKDEQKKIARLERELEQAKSGAAVAKALQVTEVPDDRINELEKEHETSLRAIQRVLADVTTEKDAKVEAMERKLKDLAAENDALKQKFSLSSSQGGGEANALHVNGENGKLDGVGANIEEIKKRDDMIQTLESKLASLVEENQAIAAELATAETIASASMASKESELSKRLETIKALEDQLASKGDVETKESLDTTNADDIEKLRLENQNLRKDLQNKISSLETAKMMITSLESASGSQANDLRAKLKERNVSAQSHTAYYSSLPSSSTSRLISIPMFPFFSLATKQCFFFHF